MENYTNLLGRNQHINSITQQTFAIQISCYERFIRLFSNKNLFNYRYEGSLTDNLSYELNDYSWKDIFIKFCKFYLGVFAIYFIILVNCKFDFDFSNISCEYWPILKNNSDLTKLYDSPNDIAAVRFYQEKFFGKLPGIFDLLINIFFIGLNFSLSVTLLKNPNIFSTFAYILLSCFDIYSIIWSFIETDFTLNWSSSWEGYLNYTLLTLLNFNIFSSFIIFPIRMIFFQENYSNKISVIFCLLFGIFTIFLSLYVLIIILTLVFHFMTSVIFLPIILIYWMTIKWIINFSLLPFQMVIKFCVSDVTRRCFSCCTNDKDHKLYPTEVMVDNLQIASERSKFISTIYNFLWIYIYILLTSPFVILFNNGMKVESIYKILLGFPYLSINYYSLDFNNWLIILRSII